MSSISSRNGASTAATGTARVRSRGSGYSRIVRRVMGAGLWARVSDRGMLLKFVEAWTYVGNRMPRIIRFYGCRGCKGASRMALVPQVRYPSPPPRADGGGRLRPRPRHGRSGRRRDRAGPGHRPQRHPGRAGCAGALHRPAGRHALGHLGQVPDRSLVLAGDLAHQPAGREPAPHLPGRRARAHLGGRQAGGLAGARRRSPPLAAGARASAVRGDPRDSLRTHRGVHGAARSCSRPSRSTARPTSSPHATSG